MTRNSAIFRAPVSGTAGMGANAARWDTGCPHRPRCPSAREIDRTAARVVSSHPEQGWSLLCNGIIAFDDTGELMPDGRAVRSHRPNEPVTI